MLKIKQCCRLGAFTDTTKTGRICEMPNARKRETARIPNRHKCHSQYAASQRCCPIQWRSHNVKQNDDKTAGEVLNAAEQFQNGDIIYDVEFIVFKENDDCQPILGLQTSEQMHLVKIQNNNFHRVAAVQDDSCFN